MTMRRRKKDLGSRVLSDERRYLPGGSLYLLKYLIQNVHDVLPDQVPRLMN